MSKKRRMSIKELDISNLGVWPVEYKLGLYALVAAFILGVTWWFFVRPKNQQLETLEREEATLRSDVEEKSARAANLEPLKLQLEQMEQQLQQMLRQLPSRTEMPDLIVDVSQTAQAAGLAVQLFQPGDEIKQEFYAEKPIQLRMVGNYHQFGAFVSGVASLPRVVILTMSDIALSPQNPQASARSSEPLVLAGTVRTYRYLDEEEVAEAEAAATATAAGGAK